VSEQRRHYTTNIQKGGALITECRNLLLEWSATQSMDQFIERVTEENLLGKLSRRRVRDIVNRIFRRRFDSGKTPGAEPARALLESGAPPEVTDRVLYYHASLADDLLYDFVVEFLNPKHTERGYGVTIGDAESFVATLERGGHLVRQWTPTIRTKVARGLLAACRDFRLLEGRIVKKFAPVSMPMEVFVYVAYYLKEKVGSAARILEHSDWQLFFLDHRVVEQMFLRAHQEGWVMYHVAGGVVRVDWCYANLMEAVNAIAQRAHSIA
jgi:hypothetical protein